MVDEAVPKFFQLNQKLIFTDKEVKIIHLFGGADLKLCPEELVIFQVQLLLVLLNGVGLHKALHSYAPCINLFPYRFLVLFDFLCCCIGLKPERPSSVHEIKIIEHF